METRVSLHKHSNSDPVRRSLCERKLYSFVRASHRVSLHGRIEEKKRNSPRTEDQSSLKHEISQLRKRLHDQIVARVAMEKALSYETLAEGITDEKLIPCVAKELIKEVTVLELEIVYLEKYLLSLYRKVFTERISSQLTHLQKPLYEEILNHHIEPEKESSVFDSGIHRTHSSLSHRSGCSFRMSPRSKAVAKAMDSCHSLPLSMLEQSQMDDLNKENQYPKTPNQISEEMIKCISSVICELADPPLTDEHEFVFSPASFSSSSTRGQADTTSLQLRDSSSFSSHIDNPCDRNERHERFTSPYGAMAAVRSICGDSDKLREAEPKLQCYRGLVRQLEDIDPRKLNHGEKLAFWINIHNALAMHAIVVYGTPKSNLKRVSSTLKAAYNIGGQTINVDNIQSSILGCRVPRPGQWLRLFSPTKTKFKVADPRKAYGIDRSEPLLHFALSLGNYSDPAVRVYEPETVYQELEAAKEEYITSNLNISKEQKLILPKTVESFAKESDICRAGLIVMIELFVPESLRDGIQQCRTRKSGKISVEWMPHNFEFEFKISKELAG